MKFTLCAVVLLLAAASARAEVTWQKTVVDPNFRAEGAAVADVNHDGQPDILVGDFWYEAPNWTPHEIRPPLELGDGAETWSEAFLCFAGDFNGDKWDDLLVIGFPGKAAKWYANPQNQPGHWKEHEAWPSANNESPQYVDLFGDGRKVLVMGSEATGQIAWFEPPPSGEGQWTMHPISAASTPENRVPGTERFSHGLGAGDMNGDGRHDVIIRHGWWEQPENARQSMEIWPWHEADLGPESADIFAADLNGDGRADALSSSAHGKGIWRHERKPDDNFERHSVSIAFSQSHSLRFTDINGDGLSDLITGKRYWAHGPTGDAEPNAPAVLYWFERKPDSPEFIPHQIDDSSGVGTQFSIADMNGDNLPDIVIANKSGVFVFEQARGGG